MGKYNLCLLKGCSQEEKENHRYYLPLPYLVVALFLSFTKYGIHGDFFQRNTGRKPFRPTGNGTETSLKHTETMFVL